MLRAFGLLLALVASSGTAALIHSGSPTNISPATDCAIREAAWEYGKNLMPSRGSFKTLYDALQLGACPSVAAPRPQTLDTWEPLSEPLDDHRQLFLVATQNAASNRTTPEHYHCLEEALAASRRFRRANPGVPITLALREGTHYLRDTVFLGPEDSDLEIRNYPGELAMLSGGLALEPVWKPSSRCKNCGSGASSCSCFEAPLPGVEDVPGLRLNGDCGHFLYSQYLLLHAHHRCFVTPTPIFPLTAVLSLPPLFSRSKSHRSM